MSKVICVYFGFALLRLVIGLENSQHFLKQSEVKPKLIVTSRASFPPLRVIALSSDWTMDWAASFYYWAEKLLWFWFYNTQLKTALSTLDLYDMILDKGNQRAHDRNRKRIYKTIKIVRAFSLVDRCL